MFLLLNNIFLNFPTSQQFRKFQLAAKRNVLLLSLNRTMAEKIPTHNYWTTVPNDFVYEVMFHLAAKSTDTGFFPQMLK